MPMFLSVTPAGSLIASESTTRLNQYSPILGGSAVSSDAARTPGSFATRRIPTEYPSLLTIAETDSASLVPPSGPA